MQVSRGTPKPETGGPRGAPGRAPGPSAFAFMKTFAGGMHRHRRRWRLARTRPGHKQRGTATLWAPPAARTPRGGRSRRIGRQSSACPARPAQPARTRGRAGARGGGARGRGAPAPVTWVSNRQQPMGARVGPCVRPLPEREAELRGAAAQRRGRSGAGRKPCRGAPPGQGAPDRRGDGPGTKNSRVL